MPDRNRDDEAIDALEFLAGQAEAGGETYAVGPEPAPVPRPEVELPGSPYPTSADSYRQFQNSESVAASEDEVDVATYRCLHCGYVLGGSDWRCSECGTQHSESLLARWFHGDEQQRLERILWLVVACLFIKLWFWLPVVAGFANLLSAGAAAYACWLTIHGKQNSNAGMYGVAGIAACCILACVAFGENVGYFAAIDLAVAGLLLAGIVSDASRIVILSAQNYRPIAFAMIFAAPIVGGVWYGVTKLLAGNAALTANPILAHFLLTVPPMAVNLGVWIWVWFMIRRIYRTLFGLQPEF